MSDRVVLVTGAGAGIGRSIARRFASLGDLVVAVDVDAGAAEETAGRLEAAGGRADHRAVDVTDPHQVQAAVDALVARYGQLDVAINNAGIAGPSASVRLHEYPYETWAEVLGVNLTGVWLCMKSEIAQMLKQRAGVVINMASFAGIRGGAGRIAYVASKHGVVGLTRAAALEYGGNGIRVNAIAPGPTKTGLLESIIEEDPTAEARFAGGNPQRRLAVPDDIAAAAVFLADPATSHVHGTVVSVDGGQSA